MLNKSNKTRVSLDNEYMSISTSENCRTKSSKSRLSLNNQQLNLSGNLSNRSSQKQITVMLMAISISCMVLSFPYSAFELLRKLDFDFKFLKSRQTLRFVLLLIDLNHATNFILYCLTGKKFRAEVKLIMSFCCKQQPATTTRLPVLR